MSHYVQIIGGNGFRRTAGSADRASETPVQIHLRNLIVPHVQSFRLTSLDASLAGRAKIPVDGLIEKYALCFKTIDTEHIAANFLCFDRSSIVRHHFVKEKFPEK